MLNDREKKTKKMKKLNLIVMVLILSALLSCSKKETTFSNVLLGDKIETFDDTEYNTMMKSIAIAVSETMNESPEFRQLLKTEALKMFDGDYDILISKISNMEVSSNQSNFKNSEVKMKVKELLSSKIATETKLKSGGNILDELIEAFPLLQIAIPVHAEDWIPEVYTPTVTFLPEEYKDATTEILTGYDKDGNVEYLDVINEPEVPVIVISQNERVGDTNPEQVSQPVPASPLNLTGTLSNTGVNLTWSMPGGSNNTNTMGYYIYRKSASQNDFVYIGQSMYFHNKTFNDNSVSQGTFYQYFVRSYYYNQVSEPSNTLSILSGNPNAVLSVNVYSRGINVNEVNWSNDYSSPFNFTKISRQIVGVDNYYVTLGTFAPNVHEFFDTQFPLGKRIVYKAVQVSSNNSQSNPKLDVIRTAYRDINYPSPVYVKRVHFDDWSIEQWPAGKPEFYLNVANVNIPTGATFKVVDQMEFNFNARVRNSQVFTGKKILDWYPGFWYDMLSLSLVEYDRSWGSGKVTIGVKYNKKNQDSTNIEYSGGINYEITINDDFENCGVAYYNYFDPSETIIYFQNYGARIEVSTNDY